GIRGNHLHVLADEIVPVLDVLGVPLADQKHDGRRVRRAVRGQARLPVLRDLTGTLGDLVDVVSERQGNDIRLQTVDDRAGLFTGTAMRLAQGNRFAGFL